MRPVFAASAHDRCPQLQLGVSALNFAALWADAHCYTDASATVPAIMPSTTRAIDT